MAGRAGGLHQNRGRVEQVLLTGAGRADRHRIEMRGRAGRTGDAAADQGADHRYRGGKGQHTVRTPRSSGDVIDDVADQAGAVYVGPRVGP